MKKVLKWIRIILGLLIGLLVLAFGVVYAITDWSVRGKNE